MSDTLCYCFGYTAADIENDFRDNGGSSSILAKITEAKKNHACRCGEKHPEKR